MLLEELDSLKKMAISFKWFAAITILLVGVLLPIGVKERSPHTVSPETGRIILDHDLLTNPTYPFVVELFDSYARPVVEYFTPFEKEDLKRVASGRAGGLTEFWKEHEEYWNEALDVGCANGFFVSIV